ncbi:MAG: gliding motility-associated C-terminal domain-containing protein, partial [Saprospiraceae bacterium]
ICFGSSYTFGNETYSETGIYTDTLINSVGCDSIIYLQLSVNEVYEEIQFVNLCVGEEVTIGNEVVNTSGIYTDSLLTQNGCDSIIQINVMVLEPSITNQLLEICEGEEVLIEGILQSDPGMYSDSLIAFNGCDSIIQTTLTVHQQNLYEEQAIVCFGSSYAFGNVVYTEAGTYIDTLSNSFGCDSIVYLQLSVNEVYEEEQIVNLCVGEEVMIDGQIFNTTGTYSDTIFSAAACDSIIHYYVNVLLPVLEQQAFLICEGEEILIGGNLESEPGIYVDTLLADNDCDSILITTLDVVNQIVVYDNVAFCSSDSLFFNGAYIYESGIYADTSTSVSACDSIHILEVQFFEQFTSEETYTLCPGEGITIHGFYTTEPGVYSDTLETVMGCDSILFVELLNTNENDFFQHLYICEGEGILVGDHYYTMEGIFSDTIATVENCDSIVVTQVTILPQHYTTIAYEICAGGSIIIGGVEYEQAGTYMDTLQSVEGCDSLLVYQLDVLPVEETHLEASICEGSIIVFGGNTIQSEGIYSNQLTTSEGCDSLVYLQVSVVSSFTDTLYVVACEGSSILIGGNLESEAGWYNQSFISSGGCDSIVRTRLDLVSSFESQQYEAICEGESYLFNGDYYSTEGTYVASLLSEGGCDSLVTLELEIMPVYIQQVEAEICEGAVYQSGNSSYSAAGFYTQTYSTDFGCDSIININVSVLDALETSLSYQICQGDSVLLVGSYRNSEGIFIEELQTATGCDSLVLHELMVLPTHFGEESITLCTGEGIWINGVFQTESGIYTQNLLSTLGCDSIIVTNLNFSDALSSFSEQEICIGESHYFAGDFLTEEGIYYDTLVAYSGCDSIVGLALQTVNHFVATDEYHLCEGDSIQLNNEAIGTSGVFVDTLTSEGGCDSLVFVSVYFWPAYEIEETIEICEGETYFIGNIPYAESGIYTDSITTTMGCDSVYIVTLIVNPTDSYTEEAEICEGGVYDFLGMEYSESGTYMVSWTNDFGCESIAALILMVNEAVPTFISEQICEGTTYTFGDDLLSEPGVYTEVFTATNGCDSLVELTLSVADELFSSSIVSLCTGDSLFVGGAYQFESGTYLDIYTGSSGAACDSIVETVLQFIPEIETFENYTICEGDSLFLFNEYYSTDTILSVTYESYFGCDSIVEKALEVLPVVELLTEDYEICLGESVQLSVIGSNAVTWSPSDGLSCTDCPMPEANPSSTTTYTVTAESCMGDEVSATVTVLVNYPPDITIISSTEDDGVIKGDSILLISYSNDPFALLSWSDKNGNVFCEDCDSIYIVPEFGMTYVASAVNDENCMAREEINFEIRNSCVEGILEIPNFLTPNGDGFNDFFEIRHSYFAEVSLLRIYNRWGELVFQTEAIDSDFWDGTFRGKTLNPDVYVYYIQGYCLNGNRFIEKGNVTLLK